MAITVKHTKVSTIPDGDDSSLIRPSDWNDDHTLTGLGTMAEQNANSVAITGGSISGVTIPASNVTGTLGVPNGGTGATTLTGYVKGTGNTAMTASATIPNTDITGLGTASTKDAGSPLGVATLDAGGKVPVSELPAAVLGALSYQGTWDASTNTPTLTSSVGTKGYYYVVSVAGSTNLDGITDWLIGDWAVYNGTIWQKVDNTETVTSVNGQTGAVVLTTTNIAEGTNEYFTTARARASVSAGTGISYDSSTGVITNSLPSLGGDVVGPASATDNAIARYDSTTGKLIQNSLVIIGDTGSVTGVNALTAESLTVNNNATLGSSNTDSLDVRARISSDLDPETNNAKDIGTNGRNWRDGFFGRTLHTVNLELTGTASFDGSQGTSGQVLTSAGTGATPTWTTPTTGTVTSVTGTAPVVSSGGATPAISMPAATTSVSGYLTSTDWNTFNAKQAALVSGTNIKTVNGTTLLGSGNLAVGTVTSVTGTSPIVSSGGATPAISMPAATTSVNGYLTSTDWNTFNSKGSGTVTSVGGTGTVSGISLSGTVTSSGNLTLGGTLDLSSPPTIGNTAPNTVAATTITATTSIMPAADNTGVIGDAASTWSNGQFTNLTVDSTMTVTSTLNVRAAIDLADSDVLRMGSGDDWQIFYNGTTNKANVELEAACLAISYTNNGTEIASLEKSTGTYTAKQLSASNGIVVNSNTVSASFSIPSGSSASSVGPVTLASGVSVTVPSGGRWVVF
jgi:hypothetical protein